MSTDAINAEEVKRTRKRYGLSQKSFASLLGLGEATVVRYEKGAKPNKANANLIRAAQNPRFILECIERDGDEIPYAQRKQAESYAYELISLDSQTAVKQHTPDVNELYEYALQQEILNEEAANIIGAIISFEVGRDEDDEPLQQMASQISIMKPSIVDEENRSEQRLTQIRGYLKCASEFVDRRIASLSAEESLATA